MFCPQCGQRQPSNEARFCSSCGFQLYVVTDLLKTGGQLLTSPAKKGGPLSPRSKGLRQGVLLMLSTLVLVPLTAIIGAGLLNLPGELVAVVAVMCMMGGFLRMMYALLMESSESPDAPNAAPTQYVPSASVPNYLGTHHSPSALPPPQGSPINAYRMPQRFDTGEMVPPPSVTDHTTRLLDKQPTDEPPKE